MASKPAMGTQLIWLSALLIYLILKMQLPNHMFIRFLLIRATWNTLCRNGSENIMDYFSKYSGTPDNLYSLIKLNDTYHCKKSEYFFWVIIVKTSPSFIIYKHARKMLRQTETINSNGHAILKEAFQKYFYYDSSCYESTKFIWFSLQVKQTNVLLHVYTLNKGMQFRPTDTNLIILAFCLSRVIISFCCG